MNLVYIFVLGAALVVSVVALLIVDAAVFFLTRKRHWAIRCVLLILPALGICWLWSWWLGPHELKDPQELAARFELVFKFAPAPAVTAIQYQLSDGPDSMAEWFKFEADADVLRRLAPDLKEVSRQQFMSFVDPGSGPNWWRAATSSSDRYFEGHITCPPGESPHDRHLWIAYDSGRRRVYCFIVSML